MEDILPASVFLIGRLVVFFSPFPGWTDLPLENMLTFLSFLACSPPVFFFFLPHTSQGGQFTDYGHCFSFIDMYHSTPIQFPVFWQPYPVWFLSRTVILLLFSFTKQSFASVFVFEVMAIIVEFTVSLILLRSLKNNIYLLLICDNHH